MGASLQTDRATGSGPGASKSGAIKVMVVDDSLIVRTIFSRMIQSEVDLDIVAAANSAEAALAELPRVQPDVILLDLEMPGMGGIVALPKLLAAAKSAQVLVVSSLTAAGAEHTVTALSMGAADTMLKPSPGGFNEDYRVSLLAKIRALGGKGAGARLRRSEAGTRKGSLAAPALPPRAPRRITKRPQVVAIGASTGGIHALNLFLRKLPASFDLPILITQHLPASFFPVFARQMSDAAGREAVLADEGVEIKRGRIVIAPGHAHMIVRKQGTQYLTSLASHPVKSGCMPSVDPMYETAAEAFDGNLAGVLLSGMGRDGTEGAQVILDAGGAMFAQDAETSAVWGMPRAIAESGLASAVAPPEQLADKVIASAGVHAWL